MSFVMAALVVAISGFISLSYEVLWFRAYSFVSAGGPEAFGVFLGVYLVGIAFGSLWVHRGCRRGARQASLRSPTLALGVVLLIAALGAGGFLPLVARLVGYFDWRWSLLFVCLPAAAFGAVLPLVSELVVDPDDRAGVRVAYLYVANIMGAAAGSTITGFVLLDVLSLSAINLVLFWLGVAVSCAMWIFSVTAPRRIVTLAVHVVLLAGSVGVVAPLFEQFYERLLTKERFRPGLRFTDLVENRHGVIAVGTADNGQRIVFGGGVYDGFISTDLVHDVNGLYRPLSLAALHSAPREVLVVGLGTGAWAQVVVHLPGVRSMTAIEINPGYLQLIKKYPQVAGLLEDPRVRIVVDDGRRWLRRHARRFDLIVQNTTVHWRSHTSLLLSKEYFQLVRKHLKPQGVALINTTGSSAVVRTALKVFTGVVKISNCVAVSPSALRFDRARWRAVLPALRLDSGVVFDPSRPAHRAKLARLLSEAWIGRVVTPRATLDKTIPPGPLVTDENMRCEWFPERIKRPHHRS